MNSIFQEYMDKYYPVTFANLQKGKSLDSNTVLAMLEDAFLRGYDAGQVEGYEIGYGNGCDFPR